MATRISKNGFQAGGHPRADASALDSDLNRRELFVKMALAGLVMGVPWSSLAFAGVPPPPSVGFKGNRTRDGVIGPFGEVRVHRVGEVSLPVVVSATGDAAVMDMTGRSPFVRFGSAGDKAAITLTAEGVRFGADKPVAWDADVVRRVIDALARDSQKTRGAMLLRSALHSGYPVALQQTKGKAGKGMSSAMAKGARGLASSSMVCTTRTITDIVTRTITETIDVLKTAAKQYEECYDKEVARSPCKDVPVFPGVCAAGICAARAFVDIVVGFTTVVTTIVEEVVRTVVVCFDAGPKLKLPKGQWPNPWFLGDARIVTGAVPQPAAKFGKAEIDGALKLLKDLTGFFGPFGSCLLSAQWSLAQLTTPIDLGSGPVVLPYGVRACITAECATQLSGLDFAGTLASSWGAALAALAALSPAFAAEVAGVGVVAAPAVVAAIALLPEAVAAGIVAAAALILAFLMLLLIYGTAISAQLLFQRLFTSNFDDGVVCIEHATFAIAMIQIATLGFVPTALIPPIVTG